MDDVRRRQGMRGKETVEREIRAWKKEMKDEGLFSHKTPKAPLLTVFLSDDVRTM